MVKKVKDEPVRQHAAPSVGKAADNRVQSAEQHVVGLFRFTLMTILGSIVAVMLGAYAVKARVLDVATAESGARLATAYGQQYAGFYNQIFGQASRQLASIITVGGLARVLAEGDTARLRDFTATIAASLADNPEVFLIPNQEPTENILLGYAAQNMVERARRGEELRAEVIPFRQRPLLLLARAVRNDGDEVVGVLLIGFDLNKIGANLNLFDAGTGHMVLQQKLADVPEAMRIMQYGDAQHETSPYRTITETIHPNLSVAFWLNPQIVASQTLGLFWIFVAGMALLVIAVIVGAGMLLRRTLERDASMLLQQTESLIRRETLPIGAHFTTSLFDDISRSLKRAAATTGAVAPPRIVAAPSLHEKRKGARNADIDNDDATLFNHSGTGQAPVPAIADEIFRAYDIRGIVGKTLTDSTVRLIGRAIGSEVLDANQSAVYVGRDGRLSGPQLLGVLIDGITSTGCNVINLGMVPTPLVYFATTNTDVKSGVCLTGSHNPADYNGLKIVINGETLSDQRIQALKQRILRNDFRSGKGAAETLDIGDRYMARIKDDIVLARPMTVVVDCGNGVAGAIAPQLLRAIGCTVVPLFCDVDGHFPNHHPDPGNPDNLRDLMTVVAAKKADLGIAFDGDGDRLGVVTPKGQIIWPDRLMMLYAKDLLIRNPGADIIYDVKCTRDLATVISQYGGRPMMWRTGHSLIKAKLRETGAALAGEMSGHIFFNERWFGFDDAMYAAARLLEILSLEATTADEVFAAFPANMATPELHINVSEENKFRIIEALQKQGDFSGGSMITLDGVRVDYPESWGLVRASNTTPMLAARFEGKTEADLDQVRAVFREQLLKVEPSLHIPF